jgi:hypothetical protein
MPNLRHLRILENTSKKQTTSLEDLGKAISQLSELRSMQITPSKKSVRLDALIDSMKDLQELYALDLSNTNEAVNWVQAFETFAKYPKLKRLTIRDFAWPSRDEMPKIMHSIQDSHSLEELTLMPGNVNLENVQDLVAQLESCQKPVKIILHLSMSCNDRIPILVAIPQFQTRLQTGRAQLIIN